MKMKIAIVIATSILIISLYGGMDVYVWNSQNLALGGKIILSGLLVSVTIISIAALSNTIMRNWEDN